MFWVIVVVVATGFGYAGYEISVLLDYMGLDEAAYTAQVEIYQTVVVAYGVFLLLLIYLTLEVGSRVITKDMTDEVYRLRDELSMQKSRNDDLSVQNKALENRIRIKKEELAKDQVRYENSDIFDTETGLYNESYLLSVLPIEINRAKRDKKPLVITLVEINELAHYKAQYGEVKTIQTIETIAKQIKLCAKRAGDFSFRLKDDIFAIVFSGLSVENTRRFMSFVQESIYSDEIEHKKEGVIGQLGVTISATMAFAESLPEAETFIEQARTTLKEGEADGEALIFEMIE